MARSNQRLALNVNQPLMTPREETGRQRLLRIAPGRVAKAVQAVRRLQQLASPNYDLKKSDREKIVAALREETDQLDYVLANPGKAAPVVSFDDDNEVG